MNKRVAQEGKWRIKEETVLALDLSDISKEYSKKQEYLALVRDGRGRAMDNVFIERLWPSVKYEEVYINGYETVPDAKEGIKRYMNFYHQERAHQSLDYKTSAEVYFGINNQNRETSPHLQGNQFRVLTMGSTPPLHSYPSFNFQL